MGFGLFKYVHASPYSSKKKRERERKRESKKEDKKMTCEYLNIQHNLGSPLEDSDASIIPY